MLNKPWLLATLFLAVCAANVSAQQIHVASGSSCPKGAWNPPDSGAGADLRRFYDFGSRVNAALPENGKPVEPSVAEEYLRLARQFPCNWNYGNAIHDGNSLLGLQALSRGDVGSAKAYLLASGKTPGSPQLNSFGPEMTLADALLQRGFANEVSVYLRNIAVFWKLNDGVTAIWLDEIGHGERPRLSRFRAMAIKIERDEARDKSAGKPGR